MKTFETEKGNIPEGATHYFEENENEKFAWWDENKALLLCPDNSGEWETPHGTDDISSPMPIPQTNKETPEEKEVEWVCVEGLTYKQVDFGETVETIDGDICIDSDLFFAWSNKNIVHISDVSAKDLLMNRHKLCKLKETPQQREERERLEAAKDLYTIYMSKWKFAQDWEALDDINKSSFLAIVDKTNYRKEG